MAREILETLRFLGLNHEMEVAESLEGVDDETQKDWANGNVKEILLKLMKEDAKDRSVEATEQNLMNFSGQQMMNDTGNGQPPFYFFNLPIMDGEELGNMKVYMTRNEDIFIPLKVRVAKAQKQRADLFVSIHADAFTSRQPSGSSVFALSTKGATSTAAKYLAQTQNASDLIGGVSKSGDRYVDHTMFDMVQSLTIADSLKFGKAVLNKLGKINNLHKNQVEQAGFAVLKAPDIPSILVETAFISNVEEERKLKTATFQQEVAESILAGIKAYFADGATLARRG